jgi:very-short-patch-repair endonuclease
MPDVFAENHDSDGSWRTDPEIAALAAKQHGVVSRGQLYALGIGRGAIEHRIRRQRLHRVEHMVYAVGHSVLGREARWMASVLAGGEDAALSYWSGASLLRLRMGTGPRTHVTVPRRRRNTSTITFHYVELPDDEITSEDGIPVTSPGRVVLDLAPHLRISALHRVLEAGERMPRWRGPSIPELLDRYPRRAGAPKLRAMIAAPVVMTRSELEARFLYLIDEWELPRPKMNLAVLGYEVDCVWPEQKLIVELDVFETHGSRFAFERDRRRDRKLKLAHWEVIRITAVQLVEEPDAVRADVARLLGAANP